MFIAELRLYINYLKEQLIDDAVMDNSSAKSGFYKNFCNNLKSGIAYYKNLSHTMGKSTETFLQKLLVAEEDLGLLEIKYQLG